MSIKGYYVNFSGEITMVTEKDGKYYNPCGQVLIVEDSVMEGGWEPDNGFRVDEEYTLWEDLTKLEEAINK